MKTKKMVVTMEFSIDAPTGVQRSDAINALWHGYSTLKEITNVKGTHVSWEEEEK